MENSIKKNKTINTLLTILVSTLLLSFHVYLIYFINSSFLNGFLTEMQIGFVYILGALVNILTFLLIPRFLRKIGNLNLTISLTVIEIAVLLGIAYSPWIWLIIIFFILQQGISSVIFYCLDIFLEQGTSTENAGGVRGLYLTMINLAPIITPVVVGLILNNGNDYSTVYLISAIFLIPFLLIIMTNFRKFKDPVYPKIDFQETARHFFKTKNIYDVFIDNFLLNFFYCWMVIYMPIYLREVIGFSWSELGVILGVALLPFILFQIPIGKIEDKKHDEKTILVFGFLIIASSVALMAFISEKSLVLWSVMLFISRIGASAIEVSNETYFFRHIKSTNAGYISFFRMTRSLPFLIVPLIATGAVYLLDQNYSWIVLAIIMLVGIRYAKQLS